MTKRLFSTNSSLLFLFFIGMAGVPSRFLSLVWARFTGLGDYLILVGAK
jgi:hypothetical protein